MLNQDQQPPLSPIDKEINAFLTEWDAKTFAAFLKDVLPVVEMYDVDDSGKLTVDHLVEGDQHHRDTVIMVRTVYLMSRIADFHAGKLLSLRVAFKGLWKRLEDAAPKL